MSSRYTAMSSRRSALSLRRSALSLRRSALSLRRSALSLRRSAHSLVELLVVISISGIVLSTVVLCLQSLYATTHRVRDGLAQRQQIERFVMQFRTDTHSAVTATVNSPGESAAAPTELLLTTDGNRSIVYQLMPGRIERTLKDGEAILHHDTFRISPLMTSGWQIDSDRETPLVSMSVLPPGATGPRGEPTGRSISVAGALQPARSASPAS